MSITPAELYASTDWTRDSFIHGVADEILLANPAEGLVVWPHGDETLGAEVGYEMYAHRQDLLERVDYLCGDPAAAAQDPAVRDTSNFEEPVPGFEVQGTDMNRSYSPPDGPRSYEETRAAHVKSLIKLRGYKWILDIHTTKSTQDPCLIVSECFLETEETRRIIAASAIGNIVVLPEWVPGNDNSGHMKPLVTLGLIGIERRAVSVEYSRPMAAATGVADTIATMDNLLAGKPASPDGLERTLYTVTRTLPKNLDFSTIHNFQEHPDGFWPVLCSDLGDYLKDPSKDYSGFAATRGETIVL